MESLHRLFALDALLRNSRYPVAFTTLQQELSCSPATLKRLLQTLRHQYDIPIVYCRQREGYFYDQTHNISIPGLWFTPFELQALLIIQKLLERLQLCPLKEYFQSLVNKVNKLLIAAGKTPENISKRLQIIPIAQQHVTAEIFIPLCQAVLNGHALSIRYQDIQGKISDRTISPQRLVYYRDHWYADAWCHLRKSLRIFWVAGILDLKTSEQESHCVAEHVLDQYVESAYGIFAGEPRAEAHLRFIGAAAMRVRNALWHPAQRQVIHEDGVVELWAPYSDHRELAMDILRYGAEVEVLAPIELQEEVINRLKMTLQLYQQPA